MWEYFKDTAQLGRGSVGLALETIETAKKGAPTERRAKRSSGQRQMEASGKTDPLHQGSLRAITWETLSEFLDLRKSPVLALVVLYL